MINAASPMTPRDQQFAKTTAQNLSTICKILRDKQVPYVTIEFDGSGDDGHIGDITATSVHDRDMIVLTDGDRFSNEAVTILGYSSGTVDSVPVPQTLSLYHALVEIGFQALMSGIGQGWGNGDGGQGSIFIDTDKVEAKIDFDKRFLRYENTEVILKGGNAP